jgi:hypothetical protein
MAHQRQTIRRAATAQLLDRTAAGARVYATRVVPWKRIELPAVAVYALEELVDPASQTTAPRELTRTLQLSLEGAVILSTAVDDALDNLAEEIERAVHADETFAGTASDSILTATELEVFEEGERCIGLIRLTYSVTYFTHAPEAADVRLNDFATADVRHSLNGAVHPLEQAQDVLRELDLR